jgi:hypothetical protein
VLGDYAVKIKDIIAESWYDALTGVGQNIKAASAAALANKANIGQIERDIAAGKNPQEIYNELISKGISKDDAKFIMSQIGGRDKIDKKYNKTIANIRTRQRQAGIQARTQQTPVTPPSILNDYQIIHQNPVIVQRVSIPAKKYNRDDNDNWVFYGSTKQVSPAEEQILDQVSPAADRGPEQTAAQPKPITVTDKQGTVWSYNDKDRTWYSPDGDPVTDAESIKKLRQRAEVQFQNRAMSTHELPGNQK